MNDSTRKTLKSKLSSVNRNKTKGKVRNNVERLGRSFMLPVALLPVAGILMGVGSGITNTINVVANGATVPAGAYVFGNLLSDFGGIIFGMFGILFGMAIVVAFTDDSGVAVFATLLAYTGFSVIQSAFIGTPYVGANGQTYVSVGPYLQVTDTLITTNLGITSMQTSVFGGIVIGIMTAIVFNRFHTLQLPTILGFFSGSRSVPIISFFMGGVMGFVFLIIWPPIADGINALGQAVGSLPYGTNSFVFEYVERSLIPTGLHNVWDPVFTYTPVAGSVTLMYNGQAVDTISGDTFIWYLCNGTGMSLHNFKQLQAGQIYNITNPLLYTKAMNPQTYAQGYLTYNGFTFNQIAINVPSNPGQYIQSKFPFMMFGLPAAGVAMIMAAPKNRRKEASSIIISAIATSFLVGVTEPTEFLFLFSAPLLYWGPYCLLAGLSGLLMNVLGANTGSGFSCGLIDLSLYGILPALTGNATRWWMAIVIGAVYVPIYYFLFYWWIKKFDVPTPGRMPLAEGQTALAVQEKIVEDNRDKWRTVKKNVGPKSKKGKQSANDEMVEIITELVGGFDNVTAIDACVTRLRLNVKDQSVVQVDQLKAQTKAVGVVQKGTNCQIIYGPKAAGYKAVMLEHQKEWLHEGK